MLSLGFDRTCRRWDLDKGEAILEFIFTPSGFTAQTLSRDGRYLISFGAGAIWVLPLEGDRKPFSFLRSSFSLVGPRISPDGRWIAFSSNRHGRDHTIPHEREV